MVNRHEHFKYENSTKIVGKLLTKFGYGLNSDYINNHSKLEIECDFSHRFDASWLEISKWSKKGSRKFCPNCRSCFKQSSLELYKWWYGDVTGTKKYQISRNKKKNSHSLERFIEKYGKKLGTEKYNDWKNYGISLENYISKYGEDLGQEKWDNYLEMHSKKRSLENYIKRLGPIQGQIEYDEFLERNRKSKTLEGFLEKYGNDIGEKKYKIWMHKCSTWGRNASKESIKHIIPPLLKNGFTIQDMFVGYAGSKEFCLLTESRKLYWYDCMIPSKNIIIEFNSNAWHPNKVRLGKKFNEWKSPKGNLSPTEKYKYDQLKISSAITAGYKILVIWQEDGIDHNHLLINEFINI